MSSVHANGIDIGYDGPRRRSTAGHAPRRDLVRREDFEAQVPAFTKAFQVFLPDARGHATTRWDPAGGWSYADLVDDLAAFVDELGIETFHLVGFSMGAMTGLQFAVRAPERLRTLVVAGITTQREPRTSVVRRLLDPDWIDRNDPRRAAALARRHDPVQGAGAWRRLLPLIAARRRGPAAPRPARAAPHRAPGARRGRRSGRVRAGRPRLGPQPPAARRPALRRARLQPRDHRPPAGPVQRGLRRVLPIDRVDRPHPERGRMATRRPATEIQGGSM